MDTVFVKTYRKNTTIVTDSFNMSAVLSGDSTYYMVPVRAFNADSNEVSIFLPGPNRQYYIDSFDLGRSVCNACFAGNDYYQTINNCHVNGSKQGNPIKITY